MVWVLIVVVAVLLIVLFLGLLAGRLPVDRMSEPTHTTPGIGLPDQVRAADIDGLRFDTALRGYRMEQVDEVLARLQRRIAELEDEVDDPRLPQ